MSNIKILFITTLFILLQSCGNKESDSKINKENKKEISTEFSKKEIAKTNKKTIVKAEATVKDKKFIFGEIDPKYNSVVVLFKNSIQIRYVDTNDNLILVHLNDSEVYKAPNSYSLQIASLPPTEQVNVKVKSSKLVLKFPNKDKSMWPYNTELYEGEVQLKEYTEDKIIISFKGKGFPTGGNKKDKSKLLPIEGKLIIKNYNVYDAR